MTQSTYHFESLVPSWLMHDGGYRAGLTQHMRDRMHLQGYRVDGPVRICEATGDVPPPVGMILLRVETTVDEFDVEVGED